MIKLTNHVICAMAAWMAIGVPGASADCGSIPYRSPLSLAGEFVFSKTGPSKNVQFDPMDVVVFEPGQRGIILWNGVEEILLLSTDIKVSEPVSILEVIPFPSEPAVSLGDFETFQKMQRLLIEKTMWRVASGGGVKHLGPPSSAIEITFQKQMGAHDISVVHVLDEDGFLRWVTAFLQSKRAANADIDPKFVRIIQNYVERGFEWFVFDSIDADDRLQSRQPVEYRFASDRVYYPLEISSRETGKTQVDLLLVTPQPLKQFPKFQFSLKRDDSVVIKREELAPIRDDWAAFMNRDAFAMQRVRIKGNIQKMTTDFIAR